VGHAGSLPDTGGGSPAIDGFRPFSAIPSKATPHAAPTHGMTRRRTFTVIPSERQAAPRAGESRGISGSGHEISSPCPDINRSRHSGLLSDSWFALSAGTPRDSCFVLRRSESQPSGRDDMKGRAALISDHPL
jgi:hypothetical protein